MAAYGCSKENSHIDITFINYIMRINNVGTPDPLGRPASKDRQMLRSRVAGSATPTGTNHIVKKKVMTNLHKTIDKQAIKCYNYIN